jgi:protein-disulfide isomerase
MTTSELDVPAAPPNPGPNWARLAFFFAAGAFVVSILSWVQSGRAIDEAKRAQAVTGPSIDIAGAPALGPDTATVALVEFSDYECPFCIRHFQQTMPRIADGYLKTGRILYVFRDWPVDDLHPQSIRAHEAAHCALEQHKFWEIHPRLFGPPGSHTPELLTGIARDAGLDMAAFGACVDARRSDPDIRKTSETAIGLGATGTPAFYVGIRNRAQQSVKVLQALSGAQPFEQFRQALDTALARAK